MNMEHLINKFEAYAENLKEIKHDRNSRFDRAFLHLDIEDFQQSLIDGMKFPALLLQTPEVGKEGFYDNITETYSFTWLILNKGTKVQAIAQAKAISDKILNRLATDIQTDEEIYSVVQGTDEGVFGPMGDIYGWGVSIVLESGYNGELNNEDWEDLA